jgi:NADH-quinone oxidoreductase subunit M
MYQRVIFGPLEHDENRTLTDLSARELVVLVPVLAMCLVMGLFPTPFLSRMEPSLQRMLRRVPAAVAAPTAVAGSRTAPAVLAEAR